MNVSGVLASLKDGHRALEVLDGANFLLLILEKPEMKQLENAESSR